MAKCVFLSLIILNLQGRKSKRVKFLSTKNERALSIRDGYCLKKLLGTAFVKKSSCAMYVVVKKLFFVGSLPFKTIFPKRIDNIWG